MIRKAGLKDPGIMIASRRTRRNREPAAVVSPVPVRETMLSGRVMRTASSTELLKAVISQSLDSVNIIKLNRAYLPPALYSAHLAFTLHSPCVCGAAAKQRQLTGTKRRGWQKRTPRPRPFHHHRLRRGPDRKQAGQGNRHRNPSGNAGP